MTDEKRESELMAKLGRMEQALSVMQSKIALSELSGGAGSDMGMMNARGLNGIPTWVPVEAAPHPFQIIIESPTEFRVNQGWLHMPGKALFLTDPAASYMSLSMLTTDVTTVPDYNENGNVNVYLMAGYQIWEETQQWELVFAEIVATADDAVNERVADTVTVYFPIGQLTLTDGEIDAAPTQYIRSDYTETITGIYPPPPPD